MPILTKLSRIAAAAVVTTLGGCAITPDEELLASTAAIVELAREGGVQVEVARFSRRLAGDPLPDLWQPYVILPSKPRTQNRLEPWDIVAVGVMTDADNTRQSARALYGDITFRRSD